MHIGDIEKNLYVLHRCDNPPCINPCHLFTGTSSENARDAITKGRIKRKGIDNIKAKLTESQVREIRSKYIPWEYGLEKLAKEYGVKFSSIWMIIKRKHWKHI